MKIEKREQGTENREKQKELIKKLVKLIFSNYLLKFIFRSPYNLIKYSL